MLVEGEDGVFEDYPVIEYHYFKQSHNVTTHLISGLPLPNPGKYYFKNCVFHPGLKEELKENYSGSFFDNCDMP
jgi:hypothetical protein